MDQLKFSSSCPSVQPDLKVIVDLCQICLMLTCLTSILFFIQCRVIPKWWIFFKLVNSSHWWTCQVMGSICLNITPSQWKTSSIQERSKLPWFCIILTFVQVQWIQHIWPDATTKCLLFVELNYLTICLSYKLQQSVGYVDYLWITCKY